MKCLCPKCEATIETSHLDVSTSGSSLHCSECGDKYWALREKFSLRAYKKPGRIYCFDCGQELGIENICLSCGSLCPDYCIVQATKPVARKQKRDGFNFSLVRGTKGSKPKPSKSKPSPVHKSSPAVEKAAAAGEKAGSRWLIYAAITALVLILAGATGKTYMEYKADKQYAKAFITALYGVKGGTDACLGTVDDLTAKWERETGQGADIIPRVDKKDSERLGKIKGRVDQAFESLGETSEKFTESKANLGKLHSVYGKIYELALSTPGTLDAFKTSKSKLESDFFRSADKLKQSMPKVMRDELEDAIIKYKNLEFMNQSK